MGTPLKPAHLRTVMPNIPQRDEVTEFSTCCAVMRRFNITNKKRAAAWLANVAKESGELYYTEELASGAAYEGRKDLGNVRPGDGVRFKGRGYIQITGRANYTRIANDLKIPCVATPELLERLPHRWTSAGYYWERMSSWGNLNLIADAGDFERTVLGVRGGPDASRRVYYDRAMRVLPNDLTIPGGNPTKEEEPMPNTKTPKELSEEAIEFGLKLIGTPYGTGWREGTWPDLSPLYARVTRHDSPAWYREREIICSALINVLRFEVAELPAVGRKQGDDWPGGTAAIGRHFAFAEGSRPYPPVENTPRGWLVFSPYLGPALAMQGHVGVALGNGYVLEARVPTLSRNRTENQGSAALRAGGARGYERIIPPSVWMVK